MSTVISIFVRIINILANLIVLLVIVDSVLTYFLSPYHPLRRTLDRIVAPMLAPIRRAIPAVGMFDFSQGFLKVSNRELHRDERQSIFWPKGQK